MFLLFLNIVPLCLCNFFILWWLCLFIFMQIIPLNWAFNRIDAHGVGAFGSTNVYLGWVIFDNNADSSHHIDGIIDSPTYILDFLLINLGIHVLIREYNIYARVYNLIAIILALPEQSVKYPGQKLKPLLLIWVQLV